MRLRPLLPLALAGASGCAAIPPGRSAVDSVRIVGAHALDAGEVASKLATTESPRFLGLFQGVASDYAIFDGAVLQGDLARVERYYRGKGFFEAHVRVGRVVRVNATHVGVEIVVDEGPPVLDGGVGVDGLQSVPAAVADGVREAVNDALPKGARFDETAYAGAQRTALEALTERGYAYAKVKAEAHVDLVTHTVGYAFHFAPGIGAVYGPLRFAGTQADGSPSPAIEIDEPLLRRVVHLREGAPYSSNEVESATQALLDLQVFSGVHIAPRLADPPERVVPLTVELEPTKLHAIRLGIGAEFDQTKTDVHALVGWQDLNFLGGLRSLTIDFKPGLVLFPTNIGDVTAPTDYFPEERLRVQFRQPSFIEARTSLIAQPEFNVYPLLVEPNPQSNDPVVGYVEPKVAVGVERRFGPHLFAKLVYNFQGEVPFSYKQQLDSNLPGILLSFPQLVAQLDFKDDPVHPHAGFSADIDLQTAGGIFGGTAHDLRIQPDLAGYIPIGKKLTFAVGLTLGLLFPYDYGGLIQQLPNQNLNSLGALDHDIEAVYFRGFFSGGPNSNRGYPLRGVAPHGFVPFLNPTTLNSVAAAGECDPTKVPPATIAMDTACLSPIGGFTQWEVSAELRWQISGPFGAAIFCDAGDVSQNVFPNPNSLRLNYLHMSCGVGGRYDTPVGPIRLDVGWRVPWLQIVGPVNGKYVHNETEAFAADPTFGSPPRPFGLGQPIAVAFGIGEAF